MKSTLRTVSDVFTLIGAVLQSMLFIVLVVFTGVKFKTGVVDYTTYFADKDVTYIYGKTTFNFEFIIFVILLVMLLGLLWYARMSATTGSKSWSIYGIVHSAITLDPFGLTGYICSLVDINRQKNVKSLEELELEKQIRISKLENELDKLKQ